MLVVTGKLVGMAPLGFSRAIQSVKNTGESHDAFETRTWKERMHTDENGEMFIPAQALKNCLAEVAKFLSETVPGKGKATYTKHFEAGIMVTENLMLGVKGDSAEGFRIFVPADGRRGSGSRVWKTFPHLKTWSAKFTVYVVDPMLQDKPEKIEEYLNHAGKFIGLGYFRPRNNGYWGRFKVENFKAVKDALAA